MPTRYVFIQLPGEIEAVPAGRLDLVEDGTRLLTSRFLYGNLYKKRPNAVEIDPVSLPMADERGVEREPVAGLALFGAVRDAAPDSWGRRVIENRLRAPPNGLAESTYLDQAGSDRAGALDIRAARDSPPMLRPLPSTLDLRYLLEAAERIEAGEPVPARLAAYFDGAPTLGGARPKAVVDVDGRPFVAKFPLPGDGFNMPVIERATLELARRAGLQVPETRIETLADGRDVMLIARFDREPAGRGLARSHMVSALTMLGVHEQQSPDQSYAAMAEVISRRGPADALRTDREELFGRMVFNILVSNDDDHLRNHAFVFDAATGGWRLSPLYDVVPKPQSGTERKLHLSVGPRGRLATLDNALDGAGQFGLLRPRAVEIIERIVAVVREWRQVFDELGVPARQSDHMRSAFRHADDVGLRIVRSGR